MTQNPLIKLLAHLDRKEVTRFRAFAHSPYFNKHEDVRQLVDYLSATYPHFTGKKCGREIIGKHLYPTGPHDQPKLAIVFTYALRLFEKFIRTESLGKEGHFENDEHLLRFLRERDLLFYLEKKWEGNFGGGTKLVGRNKRQPPAGPPESHWRWAAEMDASSLRLGQHGRDFLMEKQAPLDATFLSEKLRDACELLQRSRYLKRGFEEPSLLQAACHEVAENEATYQAFPTVAAYFHCYKLLCGDDPAEYPATLGKLESLAADLPTEALQVIFNHFQNFCITQINKGNDAFLRELFDIYRSQLDRSLLLVNGLLPEWHYKNIVTTGLRLDEHGWVKIFLEKYRPLLPPDVAENAFSYNLAAYYYHLKRYPEVLQLLVQVEYTDLRYNLDAKSLLLRTYFDLEEEEALLAMTESFRHFLLRNRSLTDFQKKGYFNLLKFTRRAFRLKLAKGFSNQKKWQAEVDKLQSDLAAAETVFNQKWLEGKILGF